MDGDAWGIAAAEAHIWYVYMACVIAIWYVYRRKPCGEVDAWIGDPKDKDVFGTMIMGEYLIIFLIFKFEFSRNI